MRPLSLITAAVAAACLVAPFTINAQATTTAATVTCKDGTTSKAGQGACSHHGGVNKGAAASSAATSSAPAAPTPAATAAPTPPAAAAAPTKPAGSSTASAGNGVSENNDPTGAMAKCKDGLYSHSKHRTGTCSRHGGVAQWLQPKP
jgi:hypothetical protein